MLLTNYGQVQMIVHPCYPQRLVVKPDQLIKRRGKLGLIKVDVDLNGVREWLADKMNEELEIGASKGKLTNFIIEPFVKHEPSEEVYVRYTCV